jgi:hypothetical protein
MVQTEMTLITKIVPAKLEQLKQVLAGIKDPSGPDLIALIGTVHFARWVIIDNGRRLLFDSKFDGSVDQYLTDSPRSPTCVRRWTPFGAAARVTRPAGRAATSSSSSNGC